MKKTLSVFLSMIICVLSFILPSFALVQGDYTYEIIEETAVITKYNGSATVLTIPATIDGMTVTKIDDGAFMNNTTLESVTVGSGVQSIGASVFENCTNLSNITLPETVIHIGEKAIYNTAYYNNKTNWKLKRTDTSSSSGNLGVGSGSGDGFISWEDISAPVLEYLYLGENLIEIELVGSYAVKYGTLVIADGAFKGNEGAVEVSFPRTIVSIGCNAFEGCTQLATVKNMNYVKYIGDNAFKDCTSLEEIGIDENVLFNANAISNTGYYNNAANWENGVLYMGARVVGTSADAQETIIKDGSTAIIENSINGNNVIIPSSVTSISSNAFVNGNNVTLFGFSDSYAEAFASGNSIRFIALDKYTKGDVNFDGIIDVQDYEILVGISTLQMQQTYAVGYIGDMDEDGTIDGIDVIILQMMIKEMPLSRLKGDVNGDGNVDRLDYDLLVKIVTATEKITDNVMFIRADVNADGAVDGFDAIILDLHLNSIVPLV